MKRVLILLLSLVAIAPTWSQSYPSDKEKFTKTLQTLCGDFLSKEDKDFLKDELEPSLTKMNTFPDKYFTQMVSTCNAIEAKKLKPYPDVYNYVFSVYNFIKNKQPESSFTAWQGSVDKLLDNKNVKKFSDFIETSATFFSRNAVAVSPNYEWYAYGNYIFEFTDKPTIRFTDIRLVCGFLNKDSDRKERRFLDSVVVYNTSGTFDPILKKWDGQHGTINWLKVGLKANETFAELNRYDINMKQEEFKADSVKLTSPYFPNKKILGRVDDRAFRIIRDVDKTFPKFVSYERKLSIPNIRPEMDYTGGFSLQGANLIGLGNAKEPATITIFRNAKPFMVCQSQLYTIEPKKIYSETTKVTMAFGLKDTISHPGVIFTFQSDSNYVELMRGKAGISFSPFKDTYHQLDIYSPKITWLRGSKELLLNFDFYATSQEQRVARLESFNFYDGKLYDRLQGLEQVHPLAAIFNYCYKYDEFNVPEGKIASALGKTLEQVRPLILELAGYGFISYDTDNKMVQVNKKLENFVKARSGKIDYDNLMFVCDLRPKQLEGVSQEEIDAKPYLADLQKKYKKLTDERRMKKEFGRINLETQEMQLDAVDQVILSDAQASFVLPDNGKVTVKQNRNFDFTGWVNAGRIQTHTLVANFNYAANKVNLVQTDRTTFKVRPIRQQDGTENILMTSDIIGVTGEIVIDAPDNRSGVKKDVGFPMLKSTKPSKVYYNDKNIYRGAYDSTRFYFTVDPFTVDSLDNFVQKYFSLKGELTSAGIFPVFKDSLKIMPDYSFGFSTKAPSTGYAFYGTKAKYNNKILLSNKGLQGEGKIDFLQSTSQSINLFTFLPDSTVGFAKFENRPVEIGVQYPDAVSNNAYIVYVPKSNVLKVSSTQDEDVSFFKGEAKLRGQAILRPTGMTASGVFRMPKADFGSDNFKLKRWDIDGDTTNFRIKNTFKEEGEEELALVTNNLAGHISFKERKGDFVSNNGETPMILPVMQYMIKMDAFSWLMDQDDVEFNSKEKQSDININTDLALTGNNFFSIHPKQDSLQFRAPKANFSMKEKVIKCTKTEFIDVADARIYPKNMEVTIHKKAEMDPLKEAKIVANYVTKYHTFLNANVKISARKDFLADADYPYISADSTKTMVKMDKISVDSSFQTFAVGNIDKNANFKLSPQFDYYGKMKINAANPLITFSGATRINHDCEKFAKNWMSFTSQIDPKNIQIPVSNKMKTLDGAPIAAGIVWHDSPVKDSVRLYPTFLSSMESEKDQILIAANGLLQYDFNAKEFQISSAEKFVNRDAPGNFLALHTGTCSLNGDGIINLGMDLGDITVDAVGTVNYDQATGGTEINATLKLNLPMDNGAWEAVGSRIVAYEGSKPLMLENTTLEMALRNWADVKSADKIKEEYTLSEDKKIKRVPDALEKSIVLTGVRLKNIPDAKDFEGLMSAVEGAAIVNLYGKAVMRQVMCKAFFDQRYSNQGDAFILALDVPGGPNYILDYSMVKKDGKLTIVSSDAELSSSINAIKEDKRKSRNFLYEMSTNSGFLNKLSRIFE